MDENEQQRRRMIYYIPENFISDAKLHIGQISIDTRRLIDMVVLGLACSFVAIILCFFVFKTMPTKNKIMISLFMALPGILAGFVGFNGDPMSQAITNFRKWKQNNAVKIFNPNPRLLGSDPVKVRASEVSARDKIVDKYYEYKERQMEKREEKDLVEGENFKFAYDADVDEFLDDNGDFSNFQNSDGSFDINISGSSLDESNLFYGGDGYNDDDDDGKEYYQSDFESNY